MKNLSKNLIGMILLLIVSLVLMGCPGGQEVVKPPQPTTAQFQAKKAEALKAKTELQILKSREPTAVAFNSDLDENGNEIVRNADKKRLVQVKVINITLDDGSHCSPRARVTLQVISTKERRYICGEIGKTGDIFTIEWKLLKQWK